jgi:hypothetical protein
LGNGIRKHWEIPSARRSTKSADLLAFAPPGAKQGLCTPMWLKCLDLLNSRTVEGDAKDENPFTPDG